MSCRKIDKHFPGVHALREVDFDIYAGRIHGLVGANGAGKSTLFKIIAGVIKHDSGEIEYKGSPYHIQDTQDAITHGVVTIHQDINLIHTLNVTENILLNNESEFRRAGLLNQKAMNSHIQHLLEKYEIDIDPREPVASLPNDQKKLIQIVKAMTRKASILLMDEPTSSLTQSGIDFVHALIKRLADDGVGVVFISHYLTEIFETCDTVSVLRDGSLVDESPIGETDLDTMVLNMLGKQITIGNKQSYTKQQNDILLSVRNLNIPGRIHDVSFDINKGEIVGATGLIGSGLTDLSKSLFGYGTTRDRTGSIKIGREQVTIGSPHDAIRNGMALLTNDRRREGILANFPLFENICLPILSRYRKKSGFLNVREMIETGEAGIRKLNIKAHNAHETPRTLSGGNQQKVLVAKWLETQPILFIMDEPTIGIDVGSKEEIKTIIKEIAAQGVGILLLTTEFEELEQLCDRVLVMFRGHLVAEFKDEKINKDAILHTAAGGKI
jgi:ABC-type sugar transport system ATPase subunit